MKITRILPRILAKINQEEDLRRAEGQIECHKATVRVFEGREDLQRLERRND